jgi:hypothetical protein
MSSGSKSATDVLATIAAYALVLGVPTALCLGAGAWYEYRWPCVEYETRTEQRTDCDTYGGTRLPSGQLVGESTRCTTRNVDVRYCVRRVAREDR